MKRKSGSYQVDDILCFPENISLIPFEHKTLVLSADTGNWIVLHNDSQLKYLNQLISGVTIGGVYEKAQQEDALPDDGLEHVLLYCHARHAFHYRRKVFRRKA